MTINFKICTSDPRSLTRTFEGTTKSKQGTLRAPASVMTPSITIEDDGVDLAGYNYMEIPDFGRSYYITNMTAVSNKIWQVDARVDVLGSYRSTILAATALIARRSGGFNAYLPDNSIAEETRDITTIHCFRDPDGTAIHVDAQGRVCLDRDPESESYVLITSGPGETTTP